MAESMRDYSLQAADDHKVFTRARDEDRIIVSADTDFTALLALRTDRRSSVVLFRRGTDRRPDRQPVLLVGDPLVIADVLADGSIVVFDDARIRIRSLLIGRRAGRRSDGWRDMAGS